MPILLDEGYEFQIGKGVLMEEGDDITLIGTGTVLARAWEAVQLLKKKGMHPRLINIHTIKPLDGDLIVSAARETGKIVTVEEHYRIGGLGSAVSELLAQVYPVPMRFIGVDDQYASNGPYEELLGLYGLLAEQIAETVVSFLDGA
jgi:transketolase